MCHCNQKKNKNASNALEEFANFLKRLRKPISKPGGPMGKKRGKKGYSRKDKSWKNEIDE